MINGKKCQDVQFLTEAVEAVINMEGNRRSAYDPDEYEDEQRERQMKKHLNEMFKDFASKVETLAEANGYRSVSSSSSSSSSRSSSSIRRRRRRTRTSNHSPPQGQIQSITVIITIPSMTWWSSHPPLKAEVA